MSLTLEQIAENVRLWQWRDETGGELELFFDGNWIASDPNHTNTSVSHGLYRKKPQPQVRWVNFYNRPPDEGGRWACFINASPGLSKANVCNGCIAEAVRVEFPPGTFPEEES